MLNQDVPSVNLLREGEFCALSVKIPDINKDKDNYENNRREYSG